MDIFKPGLDQLTDWLPETQESSNEQHDGTDWLGWDGWVSVGHQHSSSND